MGGLVSIVSYSCPLFMTFALASHRPNKEKVLVVAFHMVERFAKVCLKLYPLYFRLE